MKSDLPAPTAFAATPCNLIDSESIDFNFQQIAAVLPLKFSTCGIFTGGYRDIRLLHDKTIC
jgi:hypothetical protein